MTKLRKFRQKLNYKKLIKSKDNIQNKPKILKFNKTKWQKVKHLFFRAQKPYQKYKPRDQERYLISKYSNRGNSYQKVFKKRLIAIQTFKNFYGNLSQKLLKNNIKAQKKSPNNLIKIFESRLDVILYRAKFCLSIENAKQLIAHKKVLVNNRIVQNRAYNLQIGDIISIQPTCFKLVKLNVRQVPYWPIPPKYLSINYKTMQIIINKLFNTHTLTNLLFYFSLEKILKAR